MPTEPNIDQQATSSAFLGLQSYTEAQANSFFGRDTEIDVLTRQIQLNTLTIVFGRSGTGKTSLLNAGVFPKLRKNYCLPFRIRLEFRDDSPDLITQIKSVLKQEIDKYGFKVGSYPGTETLWEYFHTEPLWKTVTPILVFDQFEEIFTLAKSNPRWSQAEMPVFWEQLSNIIENTIPEKLRSAFLDQKDKIEYNYKKPKAKIVFAFREEYLPEFENITSIIPSLKTSRFRLMPMNGNQAYDVITKTWKGNIKPSEAKHIVTYLTNEPGSESFDLVTVEPSLLSQVCAFIDKERIENGGGTVSPELLNKYSKETILRSIYEETITAGNNALPSVDQKDVQRNQLREFVEEKLISSEGYRLKYNLTANDNMLRPGINVLVGKYFLREDDDAVELTHDVLTPIIKTDREKRRSEIAATIERKRARKKAVVLILASLILAGGVFAYFGIMSASAQKKQTIAEAAVKVAEQEKDSIQLLTKTLKDSTVYLQKQIDKRNQLLKGSQNKGYSDTVKIYVSDSATFNKILIELKDSITLLTNEKIELVKNVTSLNTRIKEYSGIKTEKEVEIANLNAEMSSLRKKGSADSMQISDLNKQIESLKKAAITDGETIRKLQESVKYYMAMNKKLNETLQELLNRNPGSTFPGNLRIQVYDKSGEIKTPITKDTFLVYIIPNKAANEDVLENNKAILFAKDCDGFGKLLPKLAGWQKAYFKDGYYYFHDVIQNGKYKVKICNILDGYFNLQMPSSSGEVYWRQNEKQKIAIKLGRF